MAINLQAPDIRELKPRITVFGVGGAGGNAVNNMIESGLLGVRVRGREHRRPGADLVEGGADHPDGRRRDAKVSAPARSRKSAAPPPRR